MASDDVQLSLNCPPNTCILAFFVVDHIHTSKESFSLLVYDILMYDGFIFDRHDPSLRFGILEKMVCNDCVFVANFDVFHD